VAGCEKPLFTARAIELIAEESKGVPRSINILCDMAMVYGFSSGEEKIGAEVVVELLKDRAKFGVLA
jgi:type II secretory pathway predicted ATPase ExeA